MKIFRQKISRKIVTFILGLGMIIFLFTFLLVVNQISASVKNTCEFAQKKYGEDCVDSLILSLDDEKNSYKERNHAIWALGQLGDSRALPTLKKYYTGSIPNREPLDDGISQHELKKAINLLDGGVNLGAWAWRNGIF